MDFAADSAYNVVVRARVLALSLLIAVDATLVGAPRAFWSANPSQNLAIADRSGGEVIPLVASTSDGGVYVAWFDSTAGSFRVYLQRLDAAGREQWPHNGVLVSAHPQNTALFGWDMIADSQGNAVLVFSDIRDGGDLDVFAYKVGPDGQELWGADGVQLSANPDFEPAPRVVETSDGDFVFAWQRDPSAGDGDIHMQRLSPAGALRYAPGGIVAVSSAGEDPGFVILAPAESGNVIVAWLRNIRTFSSPRHIRARKFSPAGTGVWGTFTSVYDAFSVPIGYFPQIQPDGAGGAFFLWHRSDGSLYNSFVQHLSAAGGEVFPHNGVAVSTTPGMYHINPTFSRNAGSSEVLVFWNEENTLQSQWGLYGQKISGAGARAWGDGGIEYLPVSTAFKSFPRSVPYGGGAMVFLTDEPAGTDRLIALRVDAAGNQLWHPAPLVVSSSSSSKARYPVTIGKGTAKVVWEDDPGGNVDVHGQDVNADGTLGLLPYAGDVGPSLSVARSNGGLTLKWSASCSNGALDYAIYEGQLGSYYSHVMKDCSDDGGDRSEEIAPAAGDTYYLVVPLAAASEGSYGTDSNGAERPPAGAADRCLATQLLGDCPAP